MRTLCMISVAFFDPDTHTYTRVAFSQVGGWVGENETKLRSSFHSEYGFQTRYDILPGRTVLLSLLLQGLKSPPEYVGMTMGVFLVLLVVIFLNSGEYGSTRTATARCTFKVTNSLSPSLPCPLPSHPKNPSRFSPLLSSAGKHFFTGTS